MLCTVLNKSWKQHFIKKQLYGHLHPISQTIQVRQTRCGALLKEKGRIHKQLPLMDSSAHGCASVGWSGKNYLHQFCVGTRCNLEDLPEAMDDKDGWWERVRELRVVSATLWRWWWLLLLVTWNHIIVGLQMTIVK